MEIIKVLISAVASAAIVTAILVPIARPLARLARKVFLPRAKVSRPYEDTVHPVIR